MDADVFFAIFCQTEAAGGSQDHLVCLHPLTILKDQSHMRKVLLNLGTKMKTDSPIGCIVTLHWLHDRAFGTLSLRENDLSSIFVRYFIHIRSGVRCEKYYGSSMFVLERPLSSACIGFH